MNLHKYSAIIFGVLAVLSLNYQPLYAHPDNQSEQIVQRSLEEMGGIDNYNNTRYISWVFFGRRFHIWDKYTGDIRIESQDGSLILMNVNSKKGRAWDAHGEEITSSETLQKRLRFGYEAWINDSYWLVMPYKMLDAGVHLAFARQDKTADGRPASVLTMTFSDVGVTPENKYEIFFDDESHLVTQWRYYEKAEDQTPAFELSWSNWQAYGDILLSDLRGERSIGPIQVFVSIDKAYLSQPTKITDIDGAMLK